MSKASKCPQSQFPRMKSKSQLARLLRRGQCADAGVLEEDDDIQLSPTDLAMLDTIGAAQQADTAEGKSGPSRSKERGRGRGRGRGKEDTAREGKKAPKTRQGQLTPTHVFSSQFILTHVYIATFRWGLC